MMRETTSRDTKVSYTTRHLLFGKNAGNSVILIDVVKHRLLMEATLTGKVASICKAAGLRRINGGRYFTLEQDTLPFMVDIWNGDCRK